MRVQVYDQLMAMQASRRQVLKGAAGGRRGSGRLAPSGFVERAGLRRGTASWPKS